MSERLKKALKIAAASFAGIVLLLAGILYYALGTTSGLNFIISKVNSSLGDILHITADIDEGDVLHGFHTDRYFEVNVKDVVIVRADNIDLNYSVLGYLATNTFEISKLKADKLEVELTYKDDGTEESAEESAAEDDSEFRLDFLVDIRIRELLLKDFAYLSDIVDVRVPKANLALAAHDDYAAVTSGVVENPEVHLKLENIESDDDTAKTAEKKLPEILTFDSGNGAIEKITDVSLPLIPALHDFHIKHGRYYQDGYDTGYFDVEIDSQWEGTLLVVSKLKVNHEFGDVDVKGTMDFVDYYNLNFDVTGEGYKSDYNLNHYESALYGLKGQGRITGDLVNLNFEGAIEAPFKVQLQARLNALSEELPCMLRVKSDRLTFPLIENKELREKAASAIKKEDLEGFVSTLNSVEKSVSASVDEESINDSLLTFSKVDLSLDGAVFRQMPLKFSTVFSGHGFSKVKIALDSVATLDNLDISSLSLKGLLGNRSLEGNAEGVLDYAGGIGFDGRVNLKADDMGDLSAALKGPLKLDSAFNFLYREDNLSFDVDKIDLDFKLNGHEALFNVAGVAGSLDESINVEHFSFNQGDNTLSLNGQIGTNSTLKGAVDIRDLSKLVAGSKGSFIGRVNVLNNISAPVVDFAGRSDFIVFNDILISKFLFDTSVNFETGNSNLSLVSDSIHLSRYVKPYRKCFMDFSGNLKKHKLAISCGKGGGSYIAAEGGYDKDTTQYEATISNFLLVSNIVDPINLKEPLHISYNLDGEKGEVSPLTLSDGSYILHVDRTSIDKGSFATVVDLENFDLKSLARYLPEGYKTAGKVKLNSKIRYAGGVPDITADLKAQNGFVVAASAFIPYDSITMSLDADGRALNADIDVALKKALGKLNVKAQVTDPYGRRNLGGSIRLSDLKLDLFTASASVLNSLDGTANIDAKLGGTLENPLIFGSVDVEGSAEPSLSVGSVDKFNLKVTARGNHGDLKGLVTLNNSDINLSGNLNWADAARGRLNVRSQGLNLQLLSYGDAQADINTDCLLDDILKVSGNIDITKGTIRFSSLESSAIAPSKDEIFVDAKSNLRGMIVDRKKSGSINNDMAIDVNVRILDNLKINAMGLRSQVEGKLNISKISSSPEVHGKGEIALKNATANLYGHKFIFNEGRTVFKKDIANPALHFEVVADPSTLDEDVTVGVKVMGTADDPKVDLFSKPTMSKNEIISYLLYGHGLDKNDSSESENYGSVLLMTLGLGTTTGVLNSVIGVFGMDRVQVGSSGSGDETQLEVHTYVTNKLRLSYGYGIYNSVNEFKVRYELLRKLYVEFISSVDQSVDLIYSFETK